MEQPLDVEPTAWACQTCTFSNSGFMSRCEMCEASRYAVPGAAPVHAVETEIGQPFSPQGKDACGTSDAPICLDDSPTTERDTIGECIPKRHLSASELATFARDGFLILRGVVPSAECQRLVWERVAPALLRDGIDPFAPATWGDLDGTVVKGPRGDDHPIPLSCCDGRWPALFESPLLQNVLDQLHGGRRWEWAYGAAEGLGWIHIRYPVAAESVWAPPEEGWHIDGGATTLDAHASVVALPLLTTIRPGGGGTALLRGSHLRVAAMLRDGRSVRPTTIAKAHLRAGGASDVVEATGAAGDVLLIHPLLIHAPSRAHKATRARDGSWIRHGLRITFNLATQWRRRPLRASTEDARTCARSPLEHTLLPHGPLDGWLH